MAHGLEVDWVRPKNLDFIDELQFNNSSRICTRIPDALDLEPWTNRPFREIDINALDADLFSHIFQPLFIARTLQSCRNVHSYLRQMELSSDELTSRESDLVDSPLGLEVQDRLATINNGFLMLSILQDTSINAMRALKFARSSVRKVPNEIWSKIFISGLAPFGAVVYDDTEHLSTNKASLCGTKFCCPETLLFVCRRWQGIALGTPALWANVSKGHVAVPTAISSAMTDAKVKELAKTPDSKWLLARLLRDSLKGDRLMDRAVAYAERSGNLPLSLDLRCTTHPSSILDSLRAYFSRVEILCIDNWEPDTVDYLDSFHLIERDWLQLNPSPLFPELKTMIFTMSSEFGPYTRFGDREPERYIFPHVFIEAPFVKNLKLGFMFCLSSSTFTRVFWSNLEVLELDRILDARDILKILRECINLRDLIISCPSRRGDRINTSGINATQVVRLPYVRSFHYQCETDFDVDLSLLELLELPSLEVLSLTADVEPSPGMYLESTVAQDRLMQKMFCGEWPNFSTLELLHYDASISEEVQAIKDTMENFIAANTPQGVTSRKVLICGCGITEDHEDRFRLCTMEGVGGHERVIFAVQRIDKWV